MTHTMKTLCDLFREQAESGPGRIAVHHQGEDTTYEQIASRADGLAAWLQRQGLQRGDRVAMLLENSAEYVACYLGILRAGGVVVALNTDTTARDLSHTLGDALPVAVIVGRKAVRPLSEWASQFAETEGANIVRLLICVGDSPTTPFSTDWHVAALSDVFENTSTTRREPPGLDDLAQLIYTSGTSGRPKGVMLSHRNIAANCNSIISYLGLTSDDSVFVILPFFYSYGNSLLFTHLAVGGRLVIASNFVFWNRVMDLMEEQRATGLAGVPSSYAMLLHKSNFRKRAFPDLRYMTCAGGGLTPAVVEQLRNTKPHVRLFPMYGQTEATARLSTLMPEELDTKPGSIGRGIPGVTLQVLDQAGQPVQPGETGEIVAQGDNVMVGYWNDPHQTENVLRPEGLWTGDLARVDEDGYIYIEGRRSDVIKSGAYRINPKEIEEVILELAGVAEVAVVGLPDELWGESPTAYVVPSPTGDTPSQRDILDHCRRHLPRYKVIHDTRFVDSLPKTSSGKVKRTELRNAWHTSISANRR